MFSHRRATMNLTRLLSSNLIRKRLLIGLIVFSCFFVIYSIINQNDAVCFFNQEWKDGMTLKNVAENLRLRSHDSPKNIFFHETSCTSDGIVRMNSRQACAVESSGKVHAKVNLINDSNA